MKVKKYIGSFNFVFFVILLVSGIVRLWGIDFGLPLTSARHDESLIVNIAMGFGTGDLNPHFFHYPTFFMYLLYGLFGFYYALGIVTGRFVSLASFVEEFSLDPTNFYLIARFISVIFGVATVLVVYKIAEKLFDKKRGLVSALFMTFSYLAVRESHFGKVDTLGTFFLMCSMFFIVKSFKVKTFKDYMLAGLFGGLAMSTRYAGVLLVFPMMVGHLCSVLSNKKKRLISFFDKFIGVFILTFGIVFIFGSPFAILDFQRFISDIKVLSELISRPWYGVGVGRGWWYHIRVSLFYGLGWSLFFSSFAGIFVLVKRSIKKAFLLVVFPLVYFVFIGRAYTAQVRYALPMVPFFCITGAVFVCFVVKKVAEYFSIKRRNVVFYLLALVVIIPSFLSVVSFDKLIAREDIRLIATEWIYENLEGGSSMYQVGSWLGRVQLFSSLATLEEEYGVADMRGDTKYTDMLVRVLRAKIDYLKWRGSDGFDQWEYDKQQNNFSFNQEMRDELPRYIVVYETPLKVDQVTDSVPSYIKELLDESYLLLKSFEVVEVGSKKNVYDHQDAFYLPYVGFENVERPGPNIYLYELKKELFM